MDMLNEPDERLDARKDFDGRGDGVQRHDEEWRMSDDRSSARTDARNEQSREAPEYWRKLSERVSSIREKIVRRVEKVLSDNPDDMASNDRARTTKERRDDDRTARNPSKMIGRNGMSGSSA